MYASRKPRHTTMLHIPLDPALKELVFREAKARGMNTAFYCRWVLKSEILRQLKERPYTMGDAQDFFREEMKNGAFESLLSRVVDMTMEDAK